MDLCVLFFKASRDMYVLVCVCQCICFVIVWIANIVAALFVEN
jgi:hypothetical protein